MKRRRVTSWFLGLALGALAGGFVLEAGMLSLPLFVLALIWAGVEAHSPLGFAGFLAGIGASWAFVLAWGDWRCQADPSCTMPDLTGWFVVAAVLMLAGAGVTVRTLRGQRTRGA